MEKALGRYAQGRGMARPVGGEKLSGDRRQLLQLQSPAPNQKRASAAEEVTVRIIWQTEDGHTAVRDEPGAKTYMGGIAPVSEPEYPTDKGTSDAGWTEVSDVYQAPKSATRAVIQMHLRWAPVSQVVWSDVAFEEVAAPKPRLVRLAAAHLKPFGKKTPMENCQLFAPLIEEAAKQKADLVVLPETLTFAGTGRTMAQVAEPIPGPSTEYFGSLAKKHDLYIVAGLIERDENLIYNVACTDGT